MNGQLVCSGATAAAEDFVLPSLPPIDGPKWFSATKCGDKFIVKILGEIGIGEQTVEDLLQFVGISGAVEFHVNSIGGDSLTALRVYNALRHRATVTTIRGNCFSSAVEIAHTAAHVRIEASARIMVHKARAAVFGDEEQIQAAARHVAKTNQAVLNLLMRRCHAAAAFFDGNDHYFTAAEAVQLGLADEVFTDTMPEQEAPITSDQTNAFPKNGPTEEEILFNDFLAAFGQIKVRNRNLFVRGLAAWATHNSTETN